MSAGLVFGRRPPFPTKKDPHHLSILYLEWERQLRCLITGQPNPEVSHTITVGSGRNRHKPMREHFLSTPMLHPVHMDFESGSIEAFDKKHNINLWKAVAEIEAEFLWRLANGELNDILKKMTTHGVQIT